MAQELKLAVPRRHIVYPHLPPIPLSFREKIRLTNSNQKNSLTVELYLAYSSFVKMKGY